MVQAEYCFSFPICVRLLAIVSSPAEHATLGLNSCSVAGTLTVRGYPHTSLTFARYSSSDLIFSNSVVVFPSQPDLKVVSQKLTRNLLKYTGKVSK